MTNPSTGAVDLDAVRAEVPWVVAGAEHVLGDSRPTRLDKLLAKDNRVWRRLFRAWLAENHDDRYTDGFDFVTRAGSRRQAGYGDWFTALDALVPDFAEDVGDLKSALRSAGARGTGLRDTATRVAEHVATAAVGTQAVDVAKTTANHLADRAGTRVSAAAQPRAVTDPAIEVLAAAVVSIVDTKGPAMVTAMDHCAALFEYVGLAALDDDRAHLTVYTGQVRAALEALTACRDMLARPGVGPEHVAWVRGAVFRLAWYVDLGYQDIAGRLPHEGVVHIIASLGERHCPSVRRLVAPLFEHLLPGLAAWLRTACACLTAARTAIGAVPAGYDGDDHQVWGEHELAAAPAQVTTLVPVVIGWAADHDESDTDEERDTAARDCVGEDYATLAARLS
jgi:hypothetical protein